MMRCLLLTATLPILSLAWLSPSKNAWPIRQEQLACRRSCDSLTKLQVGQEDSSTINTRTTTASSLMTTSDSTSRLASAFGALAENDQYDAVLTGLCAKMLDSQTDERLLSLLQDPIQLMQEMNSRSIAASPRGLMALIDATAKTENGPAMAQVLQLCTANARSAPQGIRQYGALQASIRTFPLGKTYARVQLPDGSVTTRAQRLASVALPRDDRGQEVTSALAFLGILTGSTLVNALGMDDLALYTNTLTTTFLLVGLIDNGYDWITGAISLVADDAVNKWLPPKDKLPLGLGTGAFTGTVLRGLSRLFTVDTERDCQCEAAALFAAYSLGLPCFAFQPNSLEAAALVAESAQDNNDLPPLLSDSGMARVLIWLMAPVVMEGIKYPQLISSDPTQAQGFLKRLDQVVPQAEQWWNHIDKNAVDDSEETDSELEALLKWAYAEADLLVRSHQREILQISQRLAGGAATIGDCVAVLEQW